MNARVVPSMLGFASLNPAGAPSRGKHTPTGHAVLDAVLPGGGWPLGALIELIHERPGIGELSLLAPALARLSETKGLALVGAPYRACGPGWAQRQIRLEQMLLVNAADAGDRLWAAAQALRSGAFGAVLLWLAGPAAEKELRRLQLAAEDSGALAFLFRGPAALRQSSPAALRLSLAAGLRIDILKCRGGAPRSLELALPGRAGRRNTRSHSNVVVMPPPASRCTP